MADENNEMPVNDEQELAPFDPTKKKKKKKVVAESSTGPRTGNFDSNPTPAINDGLESTYTGLAETSSLNDASVEAVVDGGEEEEKKKRYPWEGSERDYLYDELFGRVFNILRENNPELTGDRRRTVMRPPQVLREGTKKTVFVNFMDLCKTMHRQADHVMNYLLVELGTSGSLDGQQRLVVKGRFAPKNFEVILRRYVNSYVICPGCKSPDTILSKENRLSFLRCEKCGAGRSVTEVKAGFIARVGKRKT
uniref:Eukaryotic translation initiation factor 2 subunit beta n=1 Tax=Noccaea caerulescens TaxID=107243 RepID=A0A1J3JWB1_NOCCA